MSDRCPTCGRAKRRSTRQNRMYWALVARCMSLKFNGCYWSKRSWHEHFKDLFLPSEIVKLPDGRSVVREPESADTDTAVFSDYFTQVEAWCAERGIFLDSFEEAA